MASEDIAEKICPNPDWLWGTGARHSYAYLGDCDWGRLTSMERVAKEIFKKAGIKEPRKELDVIEMYQPYSFAGLIWIEDMGIVGYGEAPQYVADGNTDMGGELPINPSGGVIACNPIGATGLIRCAEAAMQVMGKADARQVLDVNFAVSTGFGGCMWTDMLLHGKKKPN
jgi:acetyl-CoA C-acetyltransferase